MQERAGLGGAITNGQALEINEPVGLDIELCGPITIRGDDPNIMTEIGKSLGQSKARTGDSAVGIGRKKSRCDN